MNIGNFLGHLAHIDPTPGFNLSRPWDSGGSTISSTGTTQPIAVGAANRAIRSTDTMGGATGNRTVSTIPLDQVTNPNTGNHYVLGSNTKTPNSPSSGPSYDPTVVSQYDQAIAQINAGLGRVPHQLDIARANIADQFRIGQNELNSAKTQAQNTFDTQNTTNQQNYRTDKNTIADQSSAGLRGLLRILGSMGAGGSSDARFVAPQAVASEASVQRAGAGQNYAQNAQALDTNFNNFLTEDKQQRDKLTDWRAMQDRTAESNVNNTKQDLLAKLADLAGKKAAYMGGSFTGAAQPYLDQANAALNRIDELGRFKPTYNGEAPVYQAPTLDSYIEDPANTSVEQNALSDTTSPYLAMLLGQRDRRNNGLF